MPTIYIDADACPVKDEVYRVAGRYGMRVVVVANATMRILTSPLVEIVVRQGFGAADDYIAEVAGPGVKIDLLKVEGKWKVAVASMLPPLGPDAIKETLRGMKPKAEVFVPEYKQAATI